MFHRRCGAAPMSRLSPEQRIRKDAYLRSAWLRRRWATLKPTSSGQNILIGVGSSARSVSSGKPALCGGSAPLPHLGYGDNAKREARPPSIGDRSSLIRQNNASSSRRRLDLITRPKLIGGCAEAAAGTSLFFSWSSGVACGPAESVPRNRMRSSSG